MATTTWKNTPTGANYNRITIQLRFKYEAVRTGIDFDKVKFKIEPQAYFADGGENTTDSALAVFFNENAPIPTSPKPSSFTHSCNCNTTGSALHNGTRYYKWYGSTGSYTSGGDNAYPKKSTNTSVYGDWENIIVPADLPQQESIDLSFYWYAMIGKGFWGTDGSTIWASAKNYRVSASFLIPQGYEKLEGLTTVTIQTDYSMQGSANPMASDTALEHINVSWDRVADKLNNRVKKYTVQVKTYGGSGVLDSLYDTVEVPDGDTSTTYALSVTRQQMENIVTTGIGQEPHKANLKYITGQTSNTWDTFNIRVIATGEHGSVQSSWSDTRYRWNELPGSPLDGEINIEGVSKDDLIGENYWIDMRHWGKYSVQPKRILDYYLPRTSVSQDPYNVQLYYRAIFQREKDCPAPGELGYPSDLLAVSVADGSEGQPVSMTDSAAGIRIETDADGYFCYDTPIFYGHFIGYDGLSYSNEATTWTFYLGKQLGFKSDANWAIEGGREMGDYTTITPACNLIIPPLVLDGNAYLTSPNALERYTIYYSADGQEYQPLSELTASTNRDNKTFSLANSGLWKELTDKISLAGAETQMVYLKIKVELSILPEYSISFETEPQAFMMQGLSAKCKFVYADGVGTFLYSLGQYSPVVRNEMTAELEITGPSNTSLTWYLQYTSFGPQGGSATSSDWESYNLAAQGNIKLEPTSSGLDTKSVRHTVPLPSIGTEPYKYRYRIVDEKHKDSELLLPVGWGDPAYEATDLLESYYYIVKRYQMPKGISLLSPTIAEDNYANGVVKWQSSFGYDLVLNAGDKLFAITPDTISLGHIDIRVPKATNEQLYYAGDTSQSTTLQPISECNFTVDLAFDNLVQNRENYVFPLAQGVLSIGGKQGTPVDYGLPIPSENGLPRNQNTTFKLSFICRECLYPAQGWSIDDPDFQRAKLMLSITNISLVSSIQANGFAAPEITQSLSGNIERKGAGVIV